MKYFFCIILLYICTFNLSAQEIKVHNYTNWNDLLQIAKTNKKKIFIYFHAGWCVPCKTIQNIFFTDSKISTFLTDSAINVSVDIDDTSAVRIIKKFRVTTVPKIVLLTSDGYTISDDQKIPVTDKNIFFDWLKNTFLLKSKIQGPSNSLDIEYPSFYNAYFSTKPKISVSPDTIRNYLEKQFKDSAMITESNWAVLSVFSYSPYSIKILVDNYNRIYPLFGNEVTDIISNGYVRGMRLAIENKDSLYFSKLINLIQLKVWPKESKEVGFYFQWIQFLGKTGIDWPRFNLYVSIYNQKIGSNKNYEFASLIYKNCNDFKTCKYMRDLFSEIIKKEHTLKANLIYATLLFRTEEKGAAEEYFSKALALDSSDSVKDEIFKLKHTN